MQREEVQTLEDVYQPMNTTNLEIQPHITKIERNVMTQKEMYSHEKSIECVADISEPLEKDKYRYSKRDKVTGSSSNEIEEPKCPDSINVSSTGKKTDDKIEIMKIKEEHQDT